MIAFVSDNDALPGERSMAPFRAGVRFVQTFGGVTEPFKALDITYSAEGPQVKPLATFKDVPKWAPMPAPRDATADENYVSPAYARALERQQSMRRERWHPSLRLVS